MKKQMKESIAIPEGVTCTYQDSVLKCAKDSLSSERKITIPGVEVKVENNKVSFTALKGNKNTYKKIQSSLAHIHNLFKGLNEKFTYELEIAHVHFPISAKVEGQLLTVSNFFGEKTPRKAKILPNVEVEIKANKITITSPDREAAGQTAANFEKSTKLKGRDRRIYQDGIYIVSKPHGGKNA